MPENNIISRANQLASSLTSTQMLGYIAALLEVSINVQNEKSAQIIQLIQEGVSVSIDSSSVPLQVELNEPIEVTGSVDVSNWTDFDFS